MGEDEAGRGPEGAAPERLPEWAEVLALVERCIGANAGRHPGIVAEAIVAELVATYELAPRETRWAERRKNHPERVRRLSHQAFRILEAEEDERRAAHRIAAGVVRAFLFSPRRGAGQPPGGAA